MVKNLYEYHFNNRKGLIIQIDDGWGEIAPLPGFSKEDFSLAKQEALDILFEKKIPTLSSVIFGFNSAKIPFCKKPITIPLCSLNKPHSGCNTLKLKLGNLSLQDAMKQVSQFLGKYRLRLDFNGKWPLKQMLEFASHFKKTDFEYLEDPVDNEKDLVLFSKKTGFPIATDHILCEETIPSLKAVVIKPTLWGKIPQVNVPIVLSSSYESSLGILQIARLGASEIAHGLDTFSPDLIDPPLRTENGFLIWDGSNNPIRKEKLCLIATVP